MTTETESSIPITYPDELAAVPETVRREIRAIAYIVSLVTGALAVGVAGTVGVLVSQGYVGGSLGAAIIGISGVLTPVTSIIAGGLGVTHLPKVEP